MVLIVGECVRVSISGEKSSRHDGVTSRQFGISKDIVQHTTPIRDFGEGVSDRFVRKGHRRLV